MNELIRRKKRLREIEKADEKNFACYTIELSKRFLADFPNSFLGRVYYAQALYAIARYSEALIVLQAASRLCPKKYRHLVHCQLGHLYRQKGDFIRAVFWYRKAAASCSSDATYCIFLGAQLAVAGRLKEAEAVHRQATRCKDGCIDEAYFNLGLVLRAQERYGAAMKCFQKSVRIDPNYSAVKKEIADLKQVLGLKKRKA